MRVRDFDLKFCVDWQDDLKVRVRVRIRFTVRVRDRVIGLRLRNGVRVRVTG